MSQVMAGSSLPAPAPPLPALSATPEQLERMLSVIENEVFPKTELGVQAGNKVFGAAVLRDDEELSTVIAETNHETLCPLYHGEVYCIKCWSETINPADRPSPASSVFLSTHEPCCMCISSIVWSGFKKVFYLFPYETTRDQGIPHDLDIMYELWRVPRYAQRNKFCSAVGLLDLIKDCPDESRAKLLEQVDRISQKYEELSRKYHSEKAANPGNTLAFN